MWRQACGDPQGGIVDVTDALMRTDCATGDDAEPRSDLLEILSRAYPRAAPGAVTSLTAEGAELRLAGSSPQRVCGWEVWVPGDAEPDVSTTGVTDLGTAQVPGGWVVSGCAEGDYTLSTGR